MLLIHQIWLHGPMIKINRDIELGSGPEEKQDQSLSICHWNLNSIPTYNFQKLELLEDYTSRKKIDILRLSETFVNSDFSCDENNFQLSGFYLIKADHPSNIKRGGRMYLLSEFLTFKTNQYSLR